MSAEFRTGSGRPSMAGAARVTVVGLLTLLVAVVCGSSAQAAVTIPGRLGGEVLGNPVPAPLPGPNIVPRPPPRPREPGFVPAPGGLEAQVLPVPGSGGGVNDGPGAGPTVPPPVRVDADKPSENTGQSTEPGFPRSNEPVGKLSRVDDKFLKRKGVDAHQEKKEANLRPPSHYDIYIDQEGTMFGVRKGVDPKLGTPLGPLPD